MPAKLIQRQLKAYTCPFTLSMVQNIEYSKNWWKNQIITTGENPLCWTLGQDVINWHRRNPMEWPVLRTATTTVSKQVFKQCTTKLWQFNLMYNHSAENQDQYRKMKYASTNVNQNHNEGHHHHHLPPWVRLFDLFRHRCIAIISWGVHGLFFLKVCSWRCVSGVWCCPIFQVGWCNKTVCIWVSRLGFQKSLVLSLWLRFLFYPVLCIP